MITENNIFSDIYEARKGTRDHLRKRGDTWNFDDESKVEFDNFFGDLLNGLSIDGLAALIKKRKGRLNAINFLGGGQVLIDINADSATAVRLASPQESNGIKYVSGNLLQNKTWRDIPDDQDLLLSMGRAGLYGLTDNPHVLYFLVNKAWSKMSSDGSLALFQIPRTMKDSFEPWIKLVSQTPGIEAQWKLKKANDGDIYYAVLLIRGIDAPDQLPTL